MTQPNAIPAVDPSTPATEDEISDRFLTRIPGGRHLVWIYTLPILYKVLIANALIVTAGAVVGTVVTFQLTRQHDAITLPTLILGFVVVGFPLTVVVNYLVLVAAFRPIEILQRTATAVRMGDMTARAVTPAFTDPQIDHLAETFNGTLDELARERQKIDVLASQVIRAQEQERKRVARELHDDTAQLLFAQLLRISTVRATATGETLRLTEELEDLTVQSLESVRRLALELRPPALDDLGLYDALADLCQRFSDSMGIPVTFEHKGSRARLSMELKLILYRVAQEALTNVFKHAEAKHVWVEYDRAETEVTISIRDDGKGFDRDRARSTDDRGLGLGLFGMEERVALAGGSFRIWKRGLRGTEIFALIPLDGDESASAAEPDVTPARLRSPSIFSVVPTHRQANVARMPKDGPKAIHSSAY